MDICENVRQSFSSSSSSLLSSFCVFRHSTKGINYSCGMPNERIQHTSERKPTARPALLVHIDRKNTINKVFLMPFLAQCKTTLNDRQTIDDVTNDESIITQISRLYGTQPIFFILFRSLCGACKRVSSTSRGKPNRTEQNEQKKKQSAVESLMKNVKPNHIRKHVALSHRR